MAQDKLIPDDSNRGPSRDDQSSAGEAGEFTRMFRALSDEPAVEASGVFENAPRTPMSRPAERPSATVSEAQPAAASSSASGKDDPGVAAESFTQIFRSLEPAPAATIPPAPAVSKSEKAPQPPAPQAANEGFTQVFRQIPSRPRTTSSSEPVQGHVAANTPASGAGEFTQVFSSFQSGSAAAKPAPVTSSAPLPPAAQTPAPAAAVQAGPPAVPTDAAQPEQPGEFTQMFRQITPGAARPAPAPTASQAMSQPSSLPQGAAEPRPNTTAFSEPANPGSFTEIFRAPTTTRQPSQQASASQSKPFASPQASAPAPSSEGSFTQIFRSLSETPPASSTPSPTPAQGLRPGEGPAPVYPPAGLQPNAGGGDFTRMMQSLSSPEAPAQPAAQMPAAAAFFDEAPRAGGESEFTRVMRGPSLRDASQKPAPAVASAPVAPGMAIAPAKPADAPKEEPKKSKQLVMLLVVFNVLLLLALIVLGYLLLRKH